MIELKNLTVKYPGSKSNALTNINVTIKNNDFVCVLGKSGAGKSTLIRCINGLQKPTSGEVYHDNLNISNLNSKELRRVRRGVGMVFQHFNLIPRLTVLQNVLTGTFGYRNTFKSLMGWFSPQELTQVKAILNDVELFEFMNRRVEKLSGGQKQRVGIARALAQQPRVLLGDEPVASLDPGTSQNIFNLLMRIHKEHNLITIINVHDLGLAQRFATRILALKDGQLIFDGKPEEFNNTHYRETYNSHPETVFID